METLKNSTYCTIYDYLYPKPNGMTLTIYELKETKGFKINFSFIWH